MAKSSEAVLFGVRSFAERKGEVHPDRWTRLRCGTNTGESTYGNLMTDQGPVMWFKDPGARDEFQKMFGGVPVTISRKVEIKRGSEAQQLLKRLQA